MEHVALRVTAICVILLWPICVKISDIYIRTMNVAINVRTLSKVNKRPKDAEVVFSVQRLIRVAFEVRKETDKCVCQSLKRGHPAVFERYISKAVDNTFSV